MHWLAASLTFDCGFGGAIVFRDGFELVERCGGFVTVGGFAVDVAVGAEIVDGVGFG